MLINLERVSLAFNKIRKSDDLVSNLPSSLVELNYTGNFLETEEGLESKILIEFPNLQILNDRDLHLPPLTLSHDINDTR